MAFPRLEECAFRVMERHLRLSEVAKGCDWQLSLESEVLTFYLPDSGKVVLDCPIQLVGTEDERTETWLWAWANAESGLPPGALEAVNRLRKSAAESGADADFQNDKPFPYTRPTFGAEMAMLTAAVSGGYTTFRCPYPGGAAYVVIETCPKAAKLPDDPMRIIRAMTDAISNFSLDQRAAVTAFLGEPNADGAYPGGVAIQFDDLGRIAEMVTRLTRVEEPQRPVSALERLKGLFRREG